MIVLRCSTTSIRGPMQVFPFGSPSCRALPWPSYFALYEACPFYQHERTAVWPSSFRYLLKSSRASPRACVIAAEFISPATETAFDLNASTASFRCNPFSSANMRASGRVASFGFRYDYTLRRLQGGRSNAAMAHAADRTRRRIRRPGAPKSLRSFVPSTTPGVGIGLAPAINRNFRPGYLG